MPEPEDRHTPPSAKLHLPVLMHTLAKTHTHTLSLSLSHTCMHRNPDTHPCTQTLTCTHARTGTHTYIHADNQPPGTEAQVSCWPVGDRRKHAANVQCPWIFPRTLVPCGCQCAAAASWLLSGSSNLLSAHSVLLSVYGRGGPIEPSSSTTFPQLLQGRHRIPRQ